MNFDPAPVQQSGEARMDIIQYFAFYLERPKYLPVRGLQGHHGKISGNHTPACGIGAAMRSAEEHYELASFLTGLRLVDGVLDNDAAEAVGDEQDGVLVVSQDHSLDLD